MGAGENEARLYDHYGLSSYWKFGRGEAKPGGNQR
jgi:hypothetical protein